MARRTPRTKALVEKLKEPLAKPPLKYAGNKFRTADKIVPLFPSNWRESKIREPFLGAGGMLFHLIAHGWSGPIYHASDADQDLVLLLGAIREEPDTVMSLLDTMADADFYQVRSALNTARFDAFNAKRAAMLIFQNRRCFNGLWRRNQKGEFNCPIGKFASPPALYNRDNMLAIARELTSRAVVLEHMDFGLSLAMATEEDLVYLDSPYIPVSATSNFTGYSTDGFGLSEHERLATSCRELDRRGIRFVASNSHCPKTLELYAGFDVQVIKVPRSISRNGEGRGEVEEVVIRNTRLW